VVRVLAREKIPFLPRGAGTGLAGGVFVARGGVLLVCSRLNRILEVNHRDGYAVVEPGVINLHLTKAAEPFGYCYAPDPSSQSACTIGGNVGNNSGGPHTLKTGVTTNHVLGVEMVLPDGEVVTAGGPCEDAPGLDLRGVLVGSEGTLGIVTKIWVRLTRIPPAWKTLLAVFPTFESAMQGVSTIIGAGIIPAALELMDHLIITAVEQSFKLGLPLDAGAVLLIELDGLEAGLEAVADRVAALCRQEGATEVRTARNQAERAGLWSGRKKAAAAVGRLSPSYITQDVVVPRSRLPEMARTIQALEKEHGLRIANLLHAGDGNLHPLILFDERDPAQFHQMEEVSHAIIRKVIALGGSVTGEHGIGIEKVGFMNDQFTADDLAVMYRLKTMFDPQGLSNPCKLLPQGGTCIEVMPRKQAGA
jgi:glycolate oxidase